MIRRAFDLISGKPSVLNHHFANIDVYSSCAKGGETFLISLVTSGDGDQGYMTLWVGAAYPKSSRCQVWRLQVLRRKKENVFNIFCHMGSRDHISRRGKWLAKWEPINLRHLSAMFHAWSLADVEIHLSILLCDITWPHDQRDIWLGMREPLNLSHHPSKFGGCGSRGSREKTFWIFCLLKQGNIV